jgi:putative peptide zinc metalloprotease protein
VELVGEYQGSSLAETTYLVKKPAGQVMQLSRLLFLVLEAIDRPRGLPPPVECVARIE